MDVDDRGNDVTKNLRTEWYPLDQCFQDALADIATETKATVKTQLADWYEVLKKVMRLWFNGGALAQTKRAALNGTSKSTTNSGDSAATQSTDADEYYVFLYD